MSNEDVIVVLYHGALIKVCESKEAFRIWQDKYSQYDRAELTVLMANVFRKS